MQNIITTKKTIIMLGVLATTLFLTGVADAQGTPPSGNVPAPINVGTTTQSKNGVLGVTGFANFGVSNLLKKVSIGCIATNMTGCIGDFGPILEVGYGTSRFDYDATMNRKLLFPSSTAARIGVGTQNPDKQLHVHSTNGPAGVVISTGSSNFMQLYQPYNAGELRIGHGAGTNITDLVTIKAAGNVGIGTTDPTKKLEVYGSALIGGEGNTINGSASHGVVYLGDTNHYIRSVTGGGLRLGTYGAQDAVMVQESTGNIGLGMTNPQARLDVQGNAIVHGSVSANNTVSGSYVQAVETVTTKNLNASGILTINGIRHQNGTGASGVRAVWQASCNGGFGDKLYLGGSNPGANCQANKQLVGYIIPN